MRFFVGRAVRRGNYSPLLLILITTWLYSSAALAQVPTPDTPTDDEVNAIAKQLYCPVCENTSLDICPTQACAEWRELIREKLAEGSSEAQITQYFVDRFGDRVLAVPPPRGLNWLVYIVPLLAFLVGAYLLYRVFMTWRLPDKRILPEVTPEISAGLHPTGDEYIDKLEEELRKLQVFR